MPSRWYLSVLIVSRSVQSDSRTEILFAADRQEAMYDRKCLCLINLPFKALFRVLKISGSRRFFRLYAFTQFRHDSSVKKMIPN